MTQLSPPGFFAACDLLGAWGFKYCGNMIGAVSFSGAVGFLLGRRFHKIYVPGQFPLAPLTSLAQSGPGNTRRSPSGIFTKNI